MSNPVPKLFEARFRWVILQQMNDLREIDPTLLDTGFDKLYSAIRDAVWEKVGNPDPAKIELPQVKYFLGPAVAGIKSAVLKSSSKR